MSRNPGFGRPVHRLTPPVTAPPRNGLRTDENYQYGVSDNDVDHEARTRPHGHVTPRADGLTAKCMGPPHCGTCRRETEIAAWNRMTDPERADLILADLHTTTEYAAIANHYGDDTTRRSGVPLINHINEGLRILLALDAPTEALLAFCLHPLLQDDREFALFNPDVASHPTVLMYGMEYRNAANRYLAAHYGNPTRSPVLSPLAPVNLMLVADKVQSRKDFETYYAASHPNRERLAAYFEQWLAALGITPDDYDRLVDATTPAATPSTHA